MIPKTRCEGQSRSRPAIHPRRLEAQVETQVPGHRHGLRIGPWDVEEQLLARGEIGETQDQPLRRAARGRIEGSDLAALPATTDRPQADEPPSSTRRGFCSPAWRARPPGRRPEVPGTVPGRAPRSRRTAGCGRPPGPWPRLWRPGRRSGSLAKRRRSRSGDSCPAGRRRRRGRPCGRRDARALPSRPQAEAAPAMPGAAM